MNVAPRISSSENWAARARSATSASDLGDGRNAHPVDVADHRHDQPALGIDRHADVHVFLVDDLFLFHVDRRIDQRMQPSDWAIAFITKGIIVSLMLEST